MKKEKSLGEIFARISLLIAVLPITIFSLISQMRIWEMGNRNLISQLEGNLQKTDEELDMVLDKYATLLYDYCTDDKVINLVEKINQDPEWDPGYANEIRKGLFHISNRNQWVEGVTLITASGQVFFYDFRRASSVNSTWAGTLTPPQIDKGVHYQGFKDPIETEEGEIYLMQISRKLVDYQDIHREIGTVILSVNAETLKSIVKSNTGAKAYICIDDQVIACTDDACIGKNIKEVESNNRVRESRINKSSGWSIYIDQSTKIYKRELSSQTILWIALTGGAVLLILWANKQITEPILKQINVLVGAMNRVEDGDFKVAVFPYENVSAEVQRIVRGFNHMVEQTGQLIDQVKSSAEEQRMAELSALEAQIDPHFLYNTLDTINWKALEHEEYEISDMVGALADILRYTIRNPGGTTSVGQEIYWLRQYLVFQQAKFEHPFETVIDVPEQLETCRLHKLLLQPFVENALKHGLYQREGNCRLLITVRTAQDQLHIMIRDNGFGIPKEILNQLNDETKELEGHVGVTNVRKRLKLYYGDEATVFFESRENSYTNVHLFLPMIGEEGGFLG